MTGEDARADVETAARLSAISDAVDNLSVGMVIFDNNRRVVFCNKRYAEIYGLELEQVKAGTPISQLIEYRLNAGLKISTDADRYIRERVGNAVQLASAVHEFSDGRLVAYTITPLPNGGGMATHEDITEQERLSKELKLQYSLGGLQEELLRTRNLQFDAAINNMSQGLCFFDGSQHLLVCNELYITMYGLPPDRVRPGTAFADIVDMRYEAGSVPAMSKEDYVSWRRNIAISNEPTDSIVELSNGRTFKVRHRPMFDGGWVATHEDITEQRRSEVKIQHLAHHDSLTNLANRVLLNERVEQALSWTQFGDMVALHHIDLDHFKPVNDTLGHPAGDQLLKAVADRLSNLAGPCDTVARMGGDEFAVIQVAAHSAEAASLAQKIIQSLCEPYEIEGHQIVIGASVGIAIGHNSGLSPEDLLRNADLALYRAKEEGRGTFRFFEPGMDLQMQLRRVMEQDLRKALSAGDFELYYQPIVNLGTKAIVGFESLIRWNHPDRGLISPGVFIPLAEETGFIVPMGEWIIREACATASQWPNDLVVAVNISAIQFRSPGFVEMIVDCLNTSGLHPTRLEIEITETALLLDKDATLAILHQLRALGIRIAMDDFGTGYSSLTYLQCFPFDKIKIDQSFVRDIPENKNSLNIVRAVVALATGMGMVTTAEGVETPEQLECLVAEGCTEMQGFLFGRPQPHSTIKQLYFSGNELERGRVVAA